VLAFGEVHERDGSPYSADMRALLKAYTDKLYTRDGMVAHAANEIEGFRVQETPALVVAIARAPACSIVRALAASQAFGRTRGRCVCNWRKWAALSRWLMVYLLNVGREYSPMTTFSTAWP
jgi:hypothetical protein